MSGFESEVTEYFLEHQLQLFPETVAETPEEAEEFLEDCMAVVCKNIKEVRAYFEDEGADIAGMSNADLARNYRRQRKYLPCRMEDI